LHLSAIFLKLVIALIAYPAFHSCIGRLLEKMPHIKLGKVDCDAEPALCDRQAVRSFPTIRLYPLGTGGSSRYTPYTQYHRWAEC
jgi:hypothetical protein